MSTHIDNFEKSIGTSGAFLFSVCADGSKIFEAEAKEKKNSPF